MKNSPEAWYSDNYLPLTAGETKSVEVTVESRGAEVVPATLHFEVSGWNVPPRTTAVPVRKQGASPDSAR